MATQLWAWQDGTATDDGFNAVAMGLDGSSVWAGYANGTSTTADATGTYWAAVKLDADGSVLWEWECHPPRRNGTTGNDDNRINAAVVGRDGSVVLAGFADREFVVIKLDADGGLLWHFQDGSGDDKDYANGVVMGDDGSVVVAGTVLGDWDIPNLGCTDMAAFKLDTNGTLLWRWQDGTDAHDYANAIAMAGDGSVVIAGYSRGDLMGRNSGDDDSSSFFPQWLGGDFSAIKLDSHGAEVWRWQDGGSGFDRLNAVSMAENGSCVMAGYSSGDWDGDNNVGGDDFAAVKLDAHGHEVWRWQDGTVDDDSLQGAEVQADGTIVLGGHTAGDWSTANSGERDFAVVKLDSYGNMIWRWQGGSADTGGTPWDDELNAMAAGHDGKIVLAGRTYGSWGKTNLGEGDFMGLMLDTGPLGTSAPTAAPSAAAVSEREPPTPTPVRFTPVTPASSSSNATSIVAGVVSSIAGVALIVLGVKMRKRHIARKEQARRQAAALPVVVIDRDNHPPPIRPHSPRPPPPPPQQASLLSPVTETSTARAPAADGGDGSWGGGGGGGKGPDMLFPPARDEVVHPASEATEYVGKDVGGGGVDGPGDLHTGGKNILTTQDGTDSGGGAGGGDGGGAGEDSLEARGTAPSTHTGRSGGGGTDNIAEGDTALATTAGKDIGGADAVTDEHDQGASVEPPLTVTTSTANMSTGEREAFTPAFGGGGGAGPASIADQPKLTFDDILASSSMGRRSSFSGPGIGRAVGEAALALANSTPIPGVSESAAALSLLVKLLMDNQDNKKSTEASLRRCRSIVTMLERASKVLGKGGETTGKAERIMMEDVCDAIFDLGQLVKTYQSKNKLSQLMMSTLFRRRQDEMGAVVDRAILGLQLGLNVQVGTDVNAVRKDVSVFKEGTNLQQGSIEEAQSKSLAEARRARRKRNLDQIEIPEDHITVTDELLGKGGFGEVYLADYNGRNAAAKVMHISHDLGRRGANAVLDGSTAGQLKRQREESQRKAFLLELGTMNRLRSPYTVNVYGAITSMQDRLILVMELLAGGDLRTLLKNAQQALPEEQCRQIIGDICAGMAFLHTKKTVHGDLKSANVLLDGAGRAKIGDFGTSRWTQHTMSTGLATFTTKSSQITQMSLAWSAPEVLDADGSTYASDIYSFGIVAWEVLSRELPWSTVTHPKEIYIRVVLKNMRPVMPDDAPTKIAEVARACWAPEPADRPTFSAILERMKSNGWNE